MKLFYFLLFLNFSLSAQVGTGEWRLHVPNKKAIDVVIEGNLVYAAFENGLQVKEQIIDDDESKTNTVKDVTPISN